MGNSQSLHEFTGPKSASQLLPNTQQYLDERNSRDPLRDFNLAPPSAAVIGAGIAGVHVAYELGKLGFAVTVFEERDSIAAGETQHSLPFVGVGLIKPSLARIDLRKELIKGLFPASCPSIIARDHLFNSLFSSPLHRWIRARMRGTAFNEEEIMLYTDNLSRLSHQTVLQLASKHPVLQQHIRCSNVRVGSLEPPPTSSEWSHDTPDTGTSRVLVPVKTAHPRPIMVDPVGWTRSLAAICQEKYNVRFALCERLEELHTYLKYNVETTRSIRLSKPDPDNPSNRLFADQTYDVVVLTAGASTGALTSQTCRLPIVGFSGVAVTTESTAGDAVRGLQKLFTGSTATAEPPRHDDDDDASLVLLSGSCNLFGYRFRPKEQRPAAGAPAARGCASPLSSSAAMATATATTPGASTAAPVVGPTEGDDCGSPERYTIQGLLSLDTTHASEEKGLADQRSAAARALAAKHLTRVEAFVRVMCDQELALVEEHERVGEGEGASGVNADVTSYTRAFTPDGVPLVDHCGGAFNTFVCGGFGDQAMDFAPGSAKILRQLVRHRAELLLQEDAERQRALGLAAMAANDARGMAVASTPLPASHLADVEDGMQMLLNGKLPNGGDADPETTSGASLSSPTLCRWLNRITGGAGRREGAQRATHHGNPPALSTEGKEEEAALLHFDGNPYSTNRFRGLVKKSFCDVVLYSPATYMDAVENAFFKRTDPIWQRINKEATRLARLDNTPEPLRRFIYENMYYDRDDEERALAEGQEVLASRQRVIAMHESQPGSGAELLDHSNSMQVERERRARESISVTPFPRKKGAGRRWWWWCVFALVIAFAALPSVSGRKQLPTAPLFPPVVLNAIGCDVCAYTFANFRLQLHDLRMEREAKRLSVHEDDMLAILDHLCNPFHEGGEWMRRVVIKWDSPSSELFTNVTSHYNACTSTCRSVSEVCDRVLDTEEAEAIPLIFLNLLKDKSVSLLNHAAFKPALHAVCGVSTACTELNRNLAELARAAQADPTLYHTVTSDQPAVVDAQDMEVERMMYSMREKDGKKAEVFHREEILQLQSAIARGDKETAQRLDPTLNDFSDDEFDHLRQLYVSGDVGDL